MKRSDNIFAHVGYHDLLFAPINWSGYHWFLLIIDCRHNDLTTILFVDPLGKAAPPALKSAISTRYPTALFKELVDRIQYDSTHCGAWCAVIAKEYILLCYSHGTPSKFRIVNPSIAANTNDTPKQLSNLAFIRRERLQFQSLTH